MTIELKRHLLSWAILVLVAAAPATSNAQTRTCDSHGYVVGFFDGALSDESDAQAALDKPIRSLEGEVFNGQPIAYELYHNTTVNFVQDISEVFQQRLSEVDRNGVLVPRKEILWEISFGDIGPGSITRAILDAVPGLELPVSALSGEMLQRTADRIAGLATNPPTELDYARHREQLNAHIQDQSKLAFVSHSQGSLFMNVAYDYVVGAIGGEPIRAIHIAPASGSLRGDYTLADNDDVINKALAKFFDVPAWNVMIPEERRSSAFQWGHHLVGVYLDKTLNPYAIVQQQLTEALATTREVGGQCPTNTGDCDGNPFNGREADLDTDERNCGACGVSCPLVSDLPLFTGFACNFARCNHTRPPATLTIVTKVIGGPKVAADIPTYIMSGWPATVGSDGYQPWDNGGRIPGSAAGTSATIGAGDVSPGWLLADIEGYELTAEGLCSGFILPGDSGTCTITFCYGGDCSAP